MNSTSCNKKRILLKKQWIRSFFVYGFFVLTSNLITSVSFGVYSHAAYKNYLERLTSFPLELDTKFSRVTTEDMAKLGYFYAGYSTDIYAVINCFSCGVVLTAEADIKCETLESRHNESCTYMKDGYLPLNAISLGKPKRSETFVR
ncbi:MAG: hypothetical protein QS748_12380 [Candidatus Endonucleobacter bathymodioli]|uniref:Uncharacterized protein n=1 Tax=Candidatus Endonucleibacter bathymodioli TaxID=539814 RepID=A0AA90NT14_9GAMM|nr:hypothetical protein [Candidatus Endonucleobacter bathymodioli]